MRSFHMLSRLTRPLFVIVAMAAASAAPSQTLKPATPGLWASDAKILINGVDVAAQMRSAQTMLMANLPPAQRAQLEAAIGTQGNGGGMRQCISAAQSAAYADPDSWIKELQRQQPKCRFTLGAVTGNTVSFTGRCDDPNAFTGTLQGNVTQPDANQYQGHLSGHGTVALPVVAAVAPLGGDTAYEAQFSGRWLASDCGALAPAAR